MLITVDYKIMQAGLPSFTFGDEFNQSIASVSCPLMVSFLYAAKFYFHVGSRYLHSYSSDGYLSLRQSLWVLAFLMLTTVDYKIMQAALHSFT